MKTVYSVCTGPPTGRGNEAQHLLNRESRALAQLRPALRFAVVRLPASSRTPRQSEPSALHVEKPERRAKERGWRTYIRTRHPQPYRIEAESANFTSLIAPSTGRIMMRNRYDEMMVLNVGHFTGSGLGHCPETPHSVSRRHAPKRLTTRKPGEESVPGLCACAKKNQAEWTCPIFHPICHSACRAVIKIK